MTRNSVKTTPPSYARLCGLLYLFVILLGGFAEGYVLNILVVSDTAKTAQNILADKPLWTWGLAANFLVPVLAVAQLWFEYHLLRPVSKNLSQIAILFNTVSLAIEAISKLFLFMVLPLLEQQVFKEAFSQDQIEALTRIALIGHDIAFDITLIFFGITCLIYGYLIIKSDYLPKWIGALMCGAGLSYLISCFAILFAPNLAAQILPYAFLPALLGESSFCLWLLIMGVDRNLWQLAQTNTNGPKD